jgi:hypothetical protein
MATRAAAGGDWGELALVALVAWWLFNRQAPASTAPLPTWADPTPAVDMFGYPVGP